MFPWSYCDGGAGGTGVFRFDDGCWGGFNPLVQFSKFVPRNWGQRLRRWRDTDRHRDHATIEGTTGADILIGTAGADVICAKASDDIIRAKAGNDVVRAGADKRLRTRRDG